MDKLIQVNVLLSQALEKITDELILKKLIQLNVLLSDSLMSSSRPYQIKQLVTLNSLLVNLLENYQSFEEPIWLKLLEINFKISEATANLSCKVENLTTKDEKKEPIQRGYMEGLLATNVLLSRHLLLFPEDKDVKLLLEAKRVISSLMENRPPLMFHILIQLHLSMGELLVSAQPEEAKMSHLLRIHSRLSDTMLHLVDDSMAGKEKVTYTFEDTLEKTKNDEDQLSFHVVLKEKQKDKAPETTPTTPARENFPVYREANPIREKLPVYKEPTERQEKSVIKSTPGRSRRTPMRFEKVDHPNGHSSVVPVGRPNTYKRDQKKETKQDGAGNSETNSSQSRERSRAMKKWWKIAEESINNASKQVRPSKIHVRKPIK